MNTSDLTLQMAYLAGQIAQSTLPDIGVSAGRPEQKMDFQALLNEKRTQADRERTEQEPQKTDPSQDTEAGKTEQKDEDVAAQAAGQGVPLMLDLSSVLAGGGIVPFVGCAVVTEQAEQITAQAPALPAADAVVEGEKAAEPALPQNIERFGEAAVPQKAEQEAAPGSLISSAGQAEGEGQGAELQVKAEGQHMEQPEGQSEQSGKQPGTDQKMDVEVTQLQTGGDQKLFQGTEAAPVKVGDGAVLDTTSEQFDARLSRTIRSIADQGMQKIELKLTPEHLGNVVVELTRSEGSALHVVLRAESEHTANLLREHLGTLGSMLQNGSQQEVRIEVAHPQESGRSWQQTDQNGGGQNGQPQDFMPQALDSLLASQRASVYGSSKTGSSDNSWMEDYEIHQKGEDMGLDFTDYLQLMVQQLQNQTMDNTTDTSDMLNQLVQMSVVQMMTTVKTSIDTLVDANTLTYAASLVGKTVTVGEYGEDGKLQEVVGTVTGTGTYQGVPVIFVDGEMYALSDIMAVGTLPDIPETPDEPEGGSGEGGDTQTPET